MVVVTGITVYSAEIGTPRTVLSKPCSAGMFSPEHKFSSFIESLDVRALHYCALRLSHHLLDEWGGAVALVRKPRIQIHLPAVTVGCTDSVNDTERT